MSLFIDGKQLLLCEGTKQGNLLAMAMFAVAIVPLIKELRNIDTKQIWYAADDEKVVGLVDSLWPWLWLLS